MAATETRLLLLGAVRIFEPINGYQLRRELASWGAEDWAHLRPGSIYHGLNALASSGDLLRHDLVDGGREVAVYESTERGRATFETMIAAALTEVTPTTPLAFQTAVTMVALLPRAEARRLLAVRREHVRAWIEESEAMAGLAAGVPPHARALMEYWQDVTRVELQWLERLLRRVDAGELDFAGEPMSWTPPSDDPGWQMDVDRRKYLRLLGR